LSISLFSDFSWQSTAATSKQFLNYKSWLTYLKIYKVRNIELIKNLSDLPSGQRVVIPKFVQDLWWKLEGNFFFARKSFPLFKLINAGFELRINLH
jgi:hypothetical protein